MGDQKKPPCVFWQRGSCKFSANQCRGSHAGNPPLLRGPPPSMPPAHRMPPGMVGAPPPRGAPPPHVVPPPHMAPRMPPGMAPQSAVKRKEMAKGPDERQKKKQRRGAPTVNDIINDELTPIANQYWAPGLQHKPYDPAIIQQIYNGKLSEPNPESAIILLELSGYLENYLWKNFDPKKSTFAHVMSIIMLVNEKFRENLINIWESFHSQEDKMVPFFHRVFTVKAWNPDMSVPQKTAYLVFLIHCFQSLEDKIVRRCCLKLCSLPLWKALTAGMVQGQLRALPDLKPEWERLQANKAPPKTGKNASFDDLGVTFLPGLLSDFFAVLRSLNDKTPPKTLQTSLRYAHRFLEFLIDLMSQLRTRRFLQPLLVDTHFVISCQLTWLYTAVSALEGSEASEHGQEQGPGKLFRQLLTMVKFFSAFEVDTRTGTALTDEELLARHYEALEKFQRVAFKHFPKQLSKIAMSPVSQIETRSSLQTLLEPLSRDVLLALAQRLRLLPGVAGDTKMKPLASWTKEFLTEVIISHHELVPSQKQAVFDMPIYPTEELIFDEDRVPSENYTTGVLALPKLNLQFLTIHDYLLRNFQLFLLESTYEIREDLVKFVRTLRPRLAGSGETVFTGWARYAVPLFKFAITQVKKPKIGEAVPALVQADVTVDLSIFQGVVREEWESLREHDVLFMLTVRGKTQTNDKSGEESVEKKLSAKMDHDQSKQSWLQLNQEALGVSFVRGAEVKYVKDETGEIIGKRNKEGQVYMAKGSVRIFRVTLDSAQYQHDMQRHLEKHAEDPYGTFNLVMRRKAKENNFKAVLQTIRELMKTEFGRSPVPPWLHDVFLGYGDPHKAQYHSLPTELKTLKFMDTFLDRSHLAASFPGGVKVDYSYRAALPAPAQTRWDRDLETGPYELSFPVGQAPNYDVLQKMILYTYKDKDSGSPAQEQKDASEAKAEEHKTSFVVKMDTTEEAEPAAGAAAPEEPSETEESILREVPLPELPAAPGPFTLQPPVAPAAAASAASAAAKPASTSPAVPDLEAMSYKDLQHQAKELDVHPKGRKKADYVAALEEHFKSAAPGAAPAAQPAGDTTKTQEYIAALKTFEEAKAAHADKQKAYEKAKDARAAAEKLRAEKLSALAAKKEATKQEKDKKAKAAQEKTEEKKSCQPVPEKKAGAEVSKSDGKQRKEGKHEPLVLPLPGFTPVSIRPIRRVVARDRAPPRNKVRFTPMQVEAIKSGLNPGLTMVVGPPGTGKTDTAVQIMAELYANFPEQRTLLVTHSNHALNDLFEKIMERDIPERYLLRCGRGAEELQATKDGRDFSQFGRVNYMLSRRMELLDRVKALADSLNLGEDAAYTCESAEHFFLVEVLSRWEQFVTAYRTIGTDEEENKPPSGEDSPAAIEARRHKLLKEEFPFDAYFSRNMEEDSVFKGKSLAEDWEVAETCHAALLELGEAIQECRPFELLRTYRDRASYFMTKHARVIAMTCTHAAIRRGDLVDKNFQFDNLIMEEAAQILEIETFIPMLLQNVDAEFGSRLQRVILLGDHQQLPPVVKNRAFQKFAKLDQSLFTRFVRLGMPYIQLNAQGRMRPSLATLWNWRYQNLFNLPATLSPKYRLHANVGFLHEYQVINVEDFQGKGESTPNAYFYQNLGEAEYVVQTYMYMRLLGISASQISIITTYNGQLSLLEDVVAKRCTNNALFGPPARISTVDKFQGQQNDFILLSLVRTQNAGHIRDVRRLVVAMSRARLGLYVFCRVELFKNCYELTPTFRRLLNFPPHLLLLPSEQNLRGDGTTDQRMLGEKPAGVTAVYSVEQMGTLVAQMTAHVEQSYELYRMRVEEFERQKREMEEAREKKRRELEEQARLIAREEAEAEEAQAAERQQDSQDERNEKIVEKITSVMEDVEEEQDGEGEED